MRCSWEWLLGSLRMVLLFLTRECLSLGCTKGMAEGEKSLGREDPGMLIHFKTVLKTSSLLLSWAQQIILCDSSCCLSNAAECQLRIKHSRGSSSVLAITLLWTSHFVDVVAEAQRVKSLAPDYIAGREESVCVILTPRLQGPLVTTAGICTVPASLESTFTSIISSDPHNSPGGRQQWLS